MNLNWSAPTPNYFKALKLLMRALQSNHNARIVKVWNEDCPYPISVDRHDKDFRNYEFSYGTYATYDEIATKNDIMSLLSLEYVAKYGTREAIDNYYTNGILTDDNFKGMGISHLVKVTDLIHYLEAMGDLEIARMYREQYIDQTVESRNVKHMFDIYGYKHGSVYIPKKFSKKIYAIEILKNEEVVKQPFLLKFVQMLYSVLKYIPQKSVLQMKDYRNITYRIGGVVNGYSIQIQIPKKFSF